MNKLEIWIERLVLFFIAVVCVAITYAVLDATSSAATIEQEPVYYQYPTVPECDRPLWERVKDRCNNAK